MNLNIFKTNKNVLSTVWYLFTNILLKNIWIYLMIFIIFSISILPAISLILQGVSLDVYYANESMITSLMISTILLIGIIQVYFTNMLTKDSIGDRIASTKYSNNEFKNAILAITIPFNLVVIELLYLWIFLSFQLVNQDYIDWTMLLNMFWVVLLVIMATLFFTFIGSLKTNSFVKIIIVFGIMQTYSIIGYSGGADWVNSLATFLNKGDITSLLLYIFVVLLHMILLPFSIIDIVISTPLFFLPESPLPIWLNTIGIIITLSFSVFASYAMWWKIKIF